ncbi:long-chain-fatty-acid--CoA ligase [Aneurinibacillus sp. Ricciae_BoGa-3]|uniref:long-chain-fatty-acid--CoA ligase n=1 Tax=Aneurinibacillus sp. Ricciae_BoGa-3 TaxID=3022697 RepID=UPI00233FB340|nr:long-chain-fatty-acid--CoA ligase [Aneurinibacillus sp. Ricciae_BoGa-3]WCK52778.1 long-chain-fatty-acid--CoA ligase [Aneurinibacillus sp. Ricciae_BoGa-3]
MATLNANLKRSAASHPEAVAFEFLNKRTTYREFLQAAQNVAGNLIKMCIQKGDRVALLSGNSPEFIISYYGILLAGAEVVPINPIYTPHEIQFILQNSQAKSAIIVAPLLPAFQALKAGLPDLQQVFVLGETQETEWIRPFSKLLTPTDGIEGGNVEVTEDDVAIILYTSGTTGAPKGAMLTHRNLTSNANSIAEYLEMGQQDKTVAVLPMFHVFCMTVCMNAPIALASCIVIIPRFSLGDVIRTIQQTKATIFAGVPTMYNFMMLYPEAKPEDLETLRICISGGSALPVALLHSFEAKFHKTISEGYGLSEASPVTAFNPVDGVRKPGSIGCSIPGVENRVVDENDNELPRGEVGELVVRGPNVMKGYLNMLEDTAITLRNGWLHTGDMATMDEDGYIYIVDRKKDVIIVGGYNVYPREVEEVLYQHPEIIEAAVIGVPDENFGEAVHAYVVRCNKSVTEEALIEYCRTELAKYKVPHKIVFLEELPKNTTGKILRRSLKNFVMKG